MAAFKETMFARPVAIAEESLRAPPEFTGVFFSPDFDAALSNREAGKVDCKDRTLVIRMGSKIYETACRIRRDA